MPQKRIKTGLYLSSQRKRNWVSNLKKWRENCGSARRRKLGEGAVDEALPSSSGVVPTADNISPDLDAASGTTETVLSTSKTALEQRVIKEELPEVKQEELILYEDECQDGSLDFQPDKGLNWETTAEEEEEEERSNVPATTEEVDLPFETVYCNENAVKVKVEVEDDEDFESVAGVASQPEDCLEFVEPRLEPCSCSKSPTLWDESLVDHMESGIAKVEHPTVTLPAEAQMLNISKSSTSSEPIANHPGNPLDAQKKQYGNNTKIAGAITITKRTSSATNFKICKLCSTNEVFLSHKALMEHYKLIHEVFSIPSSPRAGKKRKITSETGMAITENQNILLKDALLSNPPRKKADGQHVFHVISLQKVPKRRRKDAKEKIAELLDFIVDQDVDPNSIDFVVRKT